MVYSEIPHSSRTAGHVLCIALLFVLSLRVLKKLLECPKFGPTLIRSYSNPSTGLARLVNGVLNFVVPDMNLALGKIEGDSDISHCAILNSL